MKRTSVFLPSKRVVVASRSIPRDLASVEMLIAAPGHGGNSGVGRRELAIGRSILPTAAKAGKQAGLANFAVIDYIAVNDL